MGKKGKKRPAAAHGEPASENGPAADRPPAEAAGRFAGRAWVAILAAVVLVAAAALFALRGLGQRPDAVRRDPGRSVLLITIDTLRADALGSYGHPTVATPFMDRLAAEGVRFEQVHAQNVVTLPSHANILIGRYPLDHGIRDNAGFRVPAGTETMATLLAKAGYRTAAFVSAFPLDSRFGLDRGFTVYDDRLGDPESRTAFVMQERPGQQAVDAARAWMAEQGAAKTFVWLHLYEPHFPYAPPEPFRSRFANDLYHGEVSYTDALLRPLVEPLLDGKSARSLVILTADHGEGLGEHGEATHGIFAYETTLRVPLILHAPGLLRPRVVGERVRHIDLLPTVLDALGLEAPAGLPGQSLLAAANGHALAPSSSYFEAMSSALNRGWAPLVGLARANYKLIDLPLPELYDLAADPGETKNLAASEPQRLEEIRAQLGRLREADRGLTRTEENAETRARLQALGYLASASPSPSKPRYTDADDPKNLIRLDTALQEVVTLYQAGDIGSALLRAETVVSERPTMSLALQQLAFLQREAGEIEAAIVSLRRALAASPEDTSAAALLGAYLNEAGRPKEAAAVLRVYAAHPEPDLDVLMPLERL